MDRMAGYREFIEQARASDEYWVEGAIIEFTEELARAMAAQGVSRADLARRLGTSPAYVTKVLRGNANFTLASMVKLARALGQTTHIHLEPSTLGHQQRPGERRSRIKNASKGKRSGEEPPK